MIELTGIQKAYGDRIVLDVPQFTFADGARYAFIGPNGSGKSTLLRILAGVLKPDAGTVRSDIPLSDTGYSPQSPYAFNQTVLHNVLLGLPRTKDAKARALDALALVGLTNLASARGSRLSGGETQRMALARMIARPHKLLLLDEPTSATDIAAEETIEEALLRYAEESGCTLIFSTHEPGQALRLATHVCMLSDGKIIESGDKETVLRAPQAEQTQQFLRRWVV